MKVLMVQPGEIPHETDIEPGLESRRFIRMRTLWP